MMRGLCIIVAISATCPTADMHFIVRNPDLAGSIGTAEWWRQRDLRPADRSARHR